MAGDKALPPEVVEQIVAKTDGVPLFVEELTKTVLESGLLREGEERYELTGPLLSLAIPTTLHDSLMARLDRLATVKDVAQLGATIGRTFAYELLRFSPGRRHVAAQSVAVGGGGAGVPAGAPPQATYTFKHALIQDAAYQSLLRSTSSITSALRRWWPSGFPRRSRRNRNCWRITIPKAGQGGGLLAAGGETRQ